MIYLLTHRPGINRERNVLRHLASVLTFWLLAINAVAATVSGQEVILDLDGNPRTERSGVVVFVDGLSHQMPETGKVITISQKGTQFSPRNVVIQRGDTLEFLNDDITFHNVFSLSKTKPFDLGIYPQDSSKFVQFDGAGLVRVYCNIHPNMTANVLVLNNSFFAITDQGGNFEIHDVPESQIVLRFWSERTAQKSVDLSIEGSTAALPQVELNDGPRRKLHKNKFGKPYSSKY